MHILLKSQVLGYGECYLGGNQTLHYRIVCQVQKHGYMISHPALFKRPAEEVSNVMLDTHSRKHDGKLFSRIFPKGRLFDDLGRKLVVRKPVSRENRELLSPDQRCQSVDGGDPGTDIVSRILSSHRIQRQTIDVLLFSRHDRPQIINGLSDAIKGSPKHLPGKSDFHRMSGKSRMSIDKRHALGSFKDLNHSFVFI